MGGRMAQIEDFIGELIDIKNRCGNTCVYIRELSWGAVALNRQAEDKRSRVQSLAERVLAMCKRRNWCLHWTSRGAYLHLEASELIESVRGKGASTPTEEAGDVLMVLMSITENEGIPWSDVIAAAEEKLKKLELLPPYQGEEHMGGSAAAKDGVELAVREITESPMRRCPECGFVMTEMGTTKVYWLCNHCGHYIEPVAAANPQGE